MKPSDDTSPQSESPSALILVIEDERSLRENLVRLLTAEGYAAVAAESGDRGLQLFRERRPSMILCDVMMPGLDGFAVLEAVRAEPCGAAVPFVFLTALSDRSDMRRGMTLGADDYLTKPFTRDEVLEAVRARLARAEVLQPSGEDAELAVAAAELRRAMEAGEFTLYYQPKIDIATGATVGAEALLRWIHPEKGMIPPGEFVPLAERCGVVCELGDFVLRRACRDAAGWMAAGWPAVHVGVNVSALQLRDPGFPSVVIGVLEEAGLDPSLLDLELTESVVVENPELVAGMLAALKARGMSLSLDDFGTGFSSMGTLRHLAFDRIKIDRGFISRLPENPRNADLVETILQMARRLDMRAVAEGVEQAGELEWLRRAGCHEAQGYFFSRPEPCGRFMEFLRSRAGAA